MSGSSFPYYVSCDLETTGLDCDSCMTLEIGIILDNLKTPLEKAPKFRRVILWDHIIGEPYALAMNAGLIKQIAKQGSLHEKLQKGQELTPAENAALDPQVAPIADIIADLHAFLRAHAWNGEDKMTFAGKNFSGFDSGFLSRLAYAPPQLKGDFEINEAHVQLQAFLDQPKGMTSWETLFPPSHRVVDVATHFWVPSIDGMTLPNLSLCLKRAGLDDHVDHTAIGDATKVCLLTRHVTETGERLYGATA